MITATPDITFKDAFIDSLKEPVFVLDGQFNVIIWNKSIAELTGLTIVEVAGLVFKEKFLAEIPDITALLKSNDPIHATVTVDGRRYYFSMECFSCDTGKCYKGALHLLDQRLLKSLPQEYLIEVINASPISTVVFDLSGSIIYSNNAYKELWRLSEDDLFYLNNKYNIFLDKQVIDLGLLPFLDRAFSGEVIQSQVFHYSFNSSSLGREESAIQHRLMAHMFPIRDTSNQVLFVVLNFTNVTEHHELQEAYRKSEERLQLALQGANLGIWDWHIPSGKLVYNDRWAQMLGYTLEEAYAATWENLLHPEDKTKAVELMKQFTNGNTNEYESEFRLKTKSGKWHWILDRGRIVERSADGSPLRAAGTHIDINDRKINEQRIIDSEIKYRRLVDNAPIGIAIVQDERIRYINNELSRMGQLKETDSVIGVPVKEFIVGAERYATFKDREAVVVGKKETAPLHTTQFRNINGGVVDVEIVTIPIKYQETDAMQVLIHDVSEHKAALKELSRNQILLNQLFENSPMGIVLLNEEFNVINVNKGFEKLFGYKNEELKDKSLIDFIVPADLQDEGTRLNLAAINGEVDYIESYRIDRNRNKKHMLIYVLPVRVDGKHIGLYGIYIDISQRLLAEEELKTRNLELDNFVYKVSHDLRAPLASILGLINLTKLEGTEVEKDYYIGLMEGQVNKLDHFIRDILSHSKNLKMSLSVTEIDFNEVVTKCFDDLGYLKAADKIVRKISIDDGRFLSDKWRINEIFRNLIGNAIKYHNPEIDNNFVEVSIRLHDAECEITVADNGIGIASDKLPHVTDMFYRGTEVSDGSGIGLYIVQKAIEKLGGTQKITSEPNIGTEFKIWLPMLEATELE